MAHRVLKQHYRAPVTTCDPTITKDSVMRSSFVKLKTLPYFSHFNARTLLSLALLSSVALSGCVRRYTQPRPDEPHALLEVRVIHHAATGPELDEVIAVNDSAVDFPVTITSPRSTIVRVRPEPVEYRVSTHYFHTIQVPEQYWVNEQYACGTYYSGRTLQTRYCTRSVPRTRIVSHRITDGACEQTSSHTPQVGGTYILQYEYFGNQQCTMQCLRQFENSAGQTQFIACGQDESFTTGVTSGGENAFIQEIPAAPSSYQSNDPNSDPNAAGSVQQAQ